MRQSIVCRVFLVGVLIILSCSLYSQPIPFASDTIKYDKTLVGKYVELKHKSCNDYCLY